MKVSAVLFLAALLLGVSVQCVLAQQNIMDFGAVPNDPSDDATLANSAAIQKAFSAAAASSATDREQQVDFWGNVLDYSTRSYASTSTGEEFVHGSPFRYAASQTVLIPAEYTFYVSYTPLVGFSGVLLQINGTLIAGSNQTLWQLQAPAGYYGVFHFMRCEQLTIVGKPQQYNATVDTAEVMESTDANSIARSASPLPITTVDVDGAGYPWWWAVLLGPLDHRPHMFYFVQCQQVAVVSLYIKNAPMFHVLIEDSADFYFKNTTIYVDVEGQKSLIAKAALLNGEEQLDRKLFPNNLPTFPLNTDGIDPSANNVLIEDFYIENYDDAVAVKPANQQGSIATCAQNMMVRNGRVKFSVGLTIGSVPPHVGVNCVSNITFTDISMKLPFKALYIKSNPGHSGTGLIESINYVNIDIQTPLWYPLWIGPQQQKQPANGTDTGCSFFYPLNQTCPTQPLVTITSVLLSNITSTGGLTLPGVILCDPTNPCTNFTFDNVSNEGLFLVSKNYVCKNADISAQNPNPPLTCSNSAITDNWSMQE